MKADVVTVGAGAAGMTAAYYAAESGLKVTVIERNDRPGKKLGITGKGRCNLTNDTDSLDVLISNVTRNGRFLYGAFSRYMPADVKDFFESRGVPLKTERGRRVFPVSDKAGDIVNCLKNSLNGRADVINGRVGELIIEEGKVKGVKTTDGRIIEADKVIIATGGLSYPKTGSDGDGYALAKQAGHTVTPLSPSLVPLEVHEGFCSDLMGLSLKNVKVSLIDKTNGKALYSELGEMLFTHFGVSGPLILSASAHIPKEESGRYIISIDLKPALSSEQLDARILRDFSENLNRNFINSLNLLLPKALVPVIVKLSGIPMGLKVNQITKEQRQGLVSLLKDFRLTVTGFRPIDEAVITRGGVNVKEVNPSTMESKLVGGLYFAGEVLDVDAYTGGYNLQIAFSTGHLAGVSCAEKKER